MKPRIFFCFLFFLSVIGYSQNLVPNSGFEDNYSGMVSSWEQPLAAYYHYATSNSLEGAAYKGNYFNGLCLLNQMGSEYFQIKLYQPLVKDSVYKLCFYAKIGGDKVSSLHQVQSLDWHFPPKPFDVKGRARIKLQPDVRFPLDTGMKYGEWRKFEQRYVAKGGESLLLIGKFFDREDSVAKVIAEMNKKILLLKGTQKKNIKKGTDSIANYYKSLPEYNSKKRTQKQYAEFRKLMAQQTKETNAYRAMMNAKTNEGTQKLATEYDLLGYYYDIRFYFDEISIVPLNGNVNISTMEVQVGIPDKMVSGQKFTLQNILFESGKSILLPASSVSLNTLVESLKKNPNLKLKIGGHTDNMGNDLANQKLSEDRAKAVMDYLISKGISSSRFSSVGYGSKSPIADNTTPTGRKQNRRVEFEIK